MPFGRNPACGRRSLKLQAAQATQTSQTTGFQDAIKPLSQFSLPIGWTAFPQSDWEWFEKVIGLALTTLAVSLGAPSWFDLLKNVANEAGPWGIPFTGRCHLERSEAESRNPASLGAVEISP